MLNTLKPFYPCRLNKAVVNLKIEGSQSLLQIIKLNEINKQYVFGKTYRVAETR